MATVGGYSHGREGSSLQNSYGPEMVPGSAPEMVPDYGPEVVTTYKPTQFHEQDINTRESPGVKPRRKICGLPVRWFWVLVGAIVLIAGVALGVGLGLGLNQSSGDSSSSSPAASDALATSTEGNSPSTTSAEPTSAEPTSTEPSSTIPESTSATSSAPVTSGTTGIADNSCTFDNPRTYTSKSGDQFRQYCFRDWPAGTAVVDGDGKVRDIDATTVYTFEDCMEACLTYNDDLGGRGTKCEAVTYNANLTSIFGGEKFGNCFLKDNAGKGSQATAEVASAILVR